VIVHYRRPRSIGFRTCSGTTTDDADLTVRARFEVSRNSTAWVNRRTAERSSEAPVAAEYSWYRCYPWSITRAESFVQRRLESRCSSPPLRRARNRSIMMPISGQWKRRAANQTSVGTSPRYAPRRTKCAIGKSSDDNSPPPCGRNVANQIGSATHVRSTPPVVHRQRRITASSLVAAKKVVRATALAGCWAVAG